MIKKLLLILFILAVAILFNLCEIRICLLFNLFHIPCVGCGLTRAIKLIFAGKILESFKYNVLPIPLLVLITIYIILYIIYKEKLVDFINKNKSKIIIISFVIMLILWLININNDLLY